ncbi:SdpA family antimicrobial peptide system protein [Bacillus atrophaeus]|uniref:SdpA family antimicrobial peptide system protein n=2 Tax=Bacillus atrophaeus TaxID=1452 RepID=UPI000D028611|nr:SdpA family antimicrobial peptide system protein [Bacillus atrophaeus]MBJ7895168.1 SdpA family antimicrobial peptide system protein [Bacillus atrophaeus]PRR87001.1 SdpA family antimicrobial peptide system protein [Bacillus atrophaeus]
MNNSSIKNKSFLMLVVISAVWMVFIGKSIIAVLPANPLSPNIDEQSFMKTLYPQGWGFFSKNPREEMINVYETKTYAQAVSWPNNSFKNIFGLDRYGRAQGIELGYLIEQIPKSIEWEKCHYGSITCLKKTYTLVTINNKTPNASLCGNLGLSRETLIPWAWSSKSRSNISKESKVLRVEVKCS